jgi:NTE family protein
LGAGSLVNSTPISHAVELGAERIYVLPTVDPAGHGFRRPPRGALDAAVRTFTLLAATRLEADLARFSSAAELVMLPTGDLGRMPRTGSGQAGHPVAAALSATRTFLGESRVAESLVA